MNFKEKLAMSKEKTEELKAKIAASAENAKKAHEAKKDEIKTLMLMIWVDIENLKGSKRRIPKS